MLERIEAVSPQGAILNLPLDDSVSGFLMDEVTGLDPVKATITSSSFAQLDGSQYQSSRREERNIILTITLEPEWGSETVRDLRKRLYAYFMPKSAVDLKFYSSDMDPVWISGRVESFETPLFSSEPQVTVSIICFDPDFYDPAPENVPGNTTSTVDTALVEYDGSVETGFVFTLTVNRALTAFSIYLNDQQLDFNGALQNLDILTISTIQGNKYVRLSRAGVETSFLYGVTPQSAWPEFQPGDNHLRVYAVGAAVPFNIVFTKKYGGL
jgi:hypothetical protein